MKLKFNKYTILKLSESSYIYQAYLVDAEAKEYHYLSNIYFRTLLDCNNYLKIIQLKEVFYELNYGKVTEIVPQKFDEYYAYLVEFFKKCEVGLATLDNWCKMRRSTVKLYDTKEINKEEMTYLLDRISYHFKNQGRALELSMIFEKIKQKRSA